MIFYLRTYLSGYSFMLKISLLQFDVFVNLYIETPVTLNQYNLFTYKGKTTTRGVERTLFVLQPIPSYIYSKNLL